VRELREQDLPLRIGTGARAAIRLPGPVADVDHALVGWLDGRAFLQPVSTALPVTLNGKPASGTCWLGDGDEIGVGSARISLKAGSDGLEFRLGFGGVDYDTLPPEAAAAVAEAARVPAADATATVRPTIPSSARWRAPLLYAGLALLALMAYALFTSRAVRIDTRPAQAAVEIAGALEIPVGGRYLLQPGRYRVTARLPGYAPATADIQVSHELNQSFRLVLQRLPGLVRITTTPPVAAEVRVDGKVVGTTPTEALSLPAGTHQLELSAPRFLPFAARLKVQGGGVRQDYAAPLAPGWAEVTVGSIPDGATVLVDGAPAGTTPVRLELMAGTRTLRLEKDGFKTLTRTVVAVAGEPQTLDGLKLASADGLVRVISDPPGARVTVAGRYRGVTPLETELPPGASYRVDLALPGHEPATRTVDLTTARGATLRVALVPQLGILEVRAEPADAQLLVDGQPAGRLGAALTLPARPHRIEVRKAGFAPYVTEVTPEPGNPKLLEVRLLRPEEAVVAAAAAAPKATASGHELRLIQPGELRMGAPRREQGRRANEVERDVRITRPFYMATREVTNRQYRAFRPNHTSGAEKFQELAAGDHPAVMLSWQDAAAYCNWLSDQEKLPRAYVEQGGRLVPAAPATTGYRLPTEAEWEWTARFNGGAGARKFPWGAAMPPPEGAGNFADESAKGFVSTILPGYNDGFPVTAPVGRFTPSPLGLYDLGGNAAEWVQDLYTVAAAGGVAVDPTGPADGQYHVIRGSSWRDGSISTLRFAARDFGDVGRLDVGFRVARSVEAAE